MLTRRPNRHPNRRRNPRRRHPYRCRFRRQNRRIPILNRRSQSRYQKTPIIR